MKRTSLFVSALALATALGCGSKETVEDSGRNVQGDPPEKVEESVAEAPPSPPSVRPFTPTKVREEPVKIAVPTAEVGTTWVESLKISQNRVLAARQGGKVDYSTVDESHEFRARIEALEVEDGAITKAKVTYEARTDQDPTAEQAARAPAHPMAMVTYIVSGKGGRLTVKYEDDTAPPAMEARAVADANFSVGSGRFVGLLPAGELQPGQSIELEPGQVAPLFEARPRKGQTVDKATLTYRGLADEGGTSVAVFGLEVEMRRLEGILKTTLKVSGELWFDPETGALVKGVAQGPMDISSETGAHGGASVTGQGAITLDASSQRPAPPKN